MTCDYCGDCEVGLVCWACFNVPMPTPTTKTKDNIVEVSDHGKYVTLVAYKNGTFRVVQTNSSKFAVEQIKRLTEEKKHAVAHAA